jgi:hypothetical protein
VILATRRVFRLGMVVAVALAIAYGTGMPLPFLAPLFALLLTARPGPPIAAKGLLALLVVVAVTLSVGVILGPLLSYYPATAILIVVLGVYLSSYLTIVRAKALFGTLLIMGFTMISAAGTVDQGLAVMVIQALMLGIAVAIAAQWLVYPLFPEDETAKPAKAPAQTAPGDWIALRATLIVVPAYLLVLTNPSAYMPIIMKAVSLGQQSSEVNARNAGRELLGSTFLGGCFAVLFWFALAVLPNLWMFFLLMLLFASYAAAKLYRVLATRYLPGFWQNALVTMLILLGPAVQDSANGDDVHTAFLVRMGLFVAVTLYAWLAIALLEHWRSRRSVSCAGKMESSTC